MGDVIPFRSRRPPPPEKTLLNIHEQAQAQRLFAHSPLCGALGCNTTADVCLEFTDTLDQIPMLRYYCAKHLSRGPVEGLK